MHSFCSFNKYSLTAYVSLVLALVPGTSQTLKKNSNLFLLPGIYIIWKTIGKKSANKQSNKVFINKHIENDQNGVIE